MPKKQSPRRIAHGALRSRKGRVAALVTCLLVCVVSTSLLAQVSLQKKAKSGSGEVSTMSLSGPPSKEYIYAGSKLIATVEPTAVNGYDAQFVSMSYLEPCYSNQSGGASWLPIGPGSFGVTSPQEYTVRVTMKNTGSAGASWTWETFSLHSLNPQDNVTWGRNSVSFPGGTYSVASGQTVTFEFTVKRPTSGPGSFNFQWQMKGPTGVGFFGEKTKNAVIPSGAWLCEGAPSNLATFVSQSVPSLMFAGRTYPVSVTMNNGGSTTWTSAGNYKLGSQVPQDNTYWGTNRVAIPSSISPGSNAVFSFNAGSPATPGIYNFQWVVVQDGGVGFFGYLSQSVSICVTSKAAMGYLDYNLDDKTDVAVWRPSTKQWLIDTNLNGAVDFTYTFGSKGSLPVPSDYNGDGKADLAAIVLAAAGSDVPSSWSFDFDRNGTADQTVSFGAYGDIPTPQDYNGDKQADIAVFRPSSGQWLIDTDRNGTADITVSFGQSGDIPVPADYNGDGKADLAVFRPSTGQWFIDTDQNGTADVTVNLGQSGDIPIAGDYNGDGRADLAAFRPSTGQWLIDTDRNGTADMTITMGQSGDIPAPGEYNGDSVTDIAVFRPSTNKWLIDTNRDGTAEYTLTLGTSGDIPLRQNGWILKAMGILSL